LRSKSYLFLLLVLGLGILSGLLYSQTKYNLGLDVQGGIRLTYQMQFTNREERQRSEEIRSQLLRILGDRAQGPLAVAEPNIMAKGLDQIVVELPGATDIGKAREVIGTSAKIQFYHARNVVSNRSPNRPYRPLDNDQKDGSPEVGFTRASTGERITFKLPNGELNPAYQAVIAGWGPPILEGTDLERAESQSSGGGFQPLMLFSGEGAAKMERWSRANPQENIAAVLDNKVLSLAGVVPGTVLSDNAVIQGQFSGSYVKNLVALLNSGALPVELKVLSEEKVDPTIGRQALDMIVLAGAISFGVIAVFMLAYYAFPGFVALIALLLYTLFTLTVLKASGATFSLASIAGFILSLGMAVDANILVFERFKEEMKNGKSLATSLELGFRRALPAIFDSNACTILTSMVLIWLGTGPVKGFATSLVIGVAISFFTAVAVTRSLLIFLVNSGIGANPKWYAVERNWFFRSIEERADTDPLPVVQKSKKWFIISAVSILVVLPFVFMGGLKPNVEFLGGYEASYSIAGKTVNAEQLRATLERNNVKGSNIKFGGEGAQRVAIITAPREGALKGLSEADAFTRLTSAAGFAPGDLRSSSSVGPAIQKETIQNAITGVIISSLLIVAWLALRFGVALGGFSMGLRFGLSAIGALVHDVLFVVGVSAVVGYAFGWEISALFITSMLTVIGFSVHDTIVIFDRIRENLRRPQPGEDIARIVNRSISQSFSRSLNTSGTVILTLIILLVVGTATPDLKLFCATMLAGILSGTYSSIYNASPILYLWDRAVGKKKGETDTLVAKAREEAIKNRVVTTTAVPDPVATNTATTGNRSYGQVRRRASAVSRSQQEIDDERP